MSANIGQLMEAASALSEGIKTQGKASAIRIDLPIARRL